GLAQAAIAVSSAPARPAALSSPARSRASTAWRTRRQSLWLTSTLVITRSNSGGAVRAKSIGHHVAGSQRSPYRPRNASYSSRTFMSRLLSFGGVVDRSRPRGRSQGVDARHGAPHCPRTLVVVSPGGRPRTGDASEVYGSSPARAIGRGWLSGSEV